MSHNRRERRRLQRELKKIDKNNQFSDLLSPEIGKEVRRKYLQKIKNEELSASSDELSGHPSLDSFSPSSDHDYNGLKSLIVNRDWKNID